MQKDSRRHQSNERPQPYSLQAGGDSHPYSLRGGGEGGDQYVKPLKNFFDSKQHVYNKERKIVAKNNIFILFLKDIL